MKKLFTSCYAHSKVIPPEAVQVQISRTAPQWWRANIKRLEWELAPSGAILKMAKEDLGDWRGAYRDQLCRLHRAGRLQEIVDGIPENSVLLCWEADPGNCHRGVLADFLSTNNLATISELPFTPATEQKEKAVDKPKRVLL